MYKILNVNQAADLLQLDQGTVRRKIKSNELPTLKTGRKSLITNTSLEYYKFLDTHKKILENIQTDAKVISFVNHKGGCSKTTSAYTIAALLNSFGNKVLFIDMDPQGNSTQIVTEPFLNDDGIIVPFQKTIKDLLLKKKNLDNVGKQNIYDVIIKSKFEFDMIPCDLSLNSVINDLENSSFKEVILKELIAEIADDYDYIIIDTPPTLGFSVVSSLTASDYVVIVTLAEAFSLVGVEQTVHLIESVRTKNMVLANPKLIEILGVIVSKVELNTNVSKYFIEELESFSYHNGINFIKDFMIPKTTKIPETQATGELITDVDPKGDAALNYFNIAMLLDMNIKKNKIKEKLSQDEF